jgi:glutamine amidotransferase
MTDKQELVVIVDYGMGNLRSVAKVVERSHVPYIISADSADISLATRLILPGVGAFGDGMANLQARGLVDALDNAVIENGTPLLGICLGMELLAIDSEEHGFTQGLGWLPAHVQRISPGGDLRVPHVGWNGIRPRSNGGLFAGFPPGATFYFTHSYVMHCDDEENISATCTYGETFPAAVVRGNVAGCQFHPEKSQRNGGVLIHRFINEGI